MGERDSIRKLSIYESMLLCKAKTYSKSYLFVKGDVLLTSGKVLAGHHFTSLFKQELYYRPCYIPGFPSPIAINIRFILS